MDRSASFFGGWFFGGPFFAPNSGFTDDAIRELSRHSRQRSKDDTERSRGRFQVEKTAAEVITDLAQQLAEEDDERVLERELRAAIESRHIDWDDEFLQQFLDAQRRLPTYQKRHDLKTEAARAEWYERRQRSLRVVL